MWIWSTLQVAFAAGLATTFDDTIYLTAYFGEVDRAFRPLHVAVGELLGFTALLLLSLAGCAIGMALPAHTVGWLGLLPIIIGLRNLLHVLRPAGGSGEQAGLAWSAEAGRSGSRPYQHTGFRSRKLTLWQALRERRTYDVALVSISNGSNNLSIYIPLFASLAPLKVIIIVPVLYAFIFTWIALAFALTRMPGLSLVLNRYAKAFFPFVLMWLGYRILNDSGALQLLTGQG